MKVSAYKVPYSDSWWLPDRTTSALALPVLGAVQEHWLSWLNLQIPGLVGWLW